MKNIDDEQWNIVWHFILQIYMTSFGETELNEQLGVWWFDELNNISDRRSWNDLA